MLRRFVLALAAAALALPMARAAERQIEFEARLLSVSEECYTDLGQPGRGGIVNLLTADEARAFLTKAQADGRTKVLPSPTVTALDGAKAVACIEEQTVYVTGFASKEVGGQSVVAPVREAFSSGFSLSLRGTARPDGSGVAVVVEAQMNLLDTAPPSPVTFVIDCSDGKAGQPVPVTQRFRPPTQTTYGIRKALDVPAGRTAAFSSGRRTREVVAEAKAPVLGDLPLLGDFFTVRTCRTETDYLIVLLTAKAVEGRGGEEAPVVPPLADAGVRMDVTTFSVCDCFWANTHGPAAKLATDNVAFLGGDGQAFRDALRDCGGCTIYAEPRMLTQAGHPATFMTDRMSTTFTPTVSADGAFVKVAGTVWGLEATAGTPVLPTLTVPDGNAVVYKLGRDCATGATLYALVTPRRVSAAGGEESEPPLVAMMAAYRKACAEGRDGDARRLALQCLAIDPACFAK